MRFSGTVCSRHPASSDPDPASDPDTIGEVVKKLDATMRADATDAGGDCRVPTCNGSVGAGAPASARKTRRRPEPQAESRVSLYDAVTSRIICELEAGHLPWVQPWGRAGATAPGLPRNALTGRCYSGVNVLILWGAVIAQGFASQSWLTFRQALDAGGCVRKGERGVTVVYADRFTPEAEKARAAETGTDARAIPFLKRFTVFNVAQCDGLRDGLASDPAPLPDRQIIPVAEEVIAASGVDFRIGGDRAFYVPSQDFVAVPPQPAFHEQVNYYRTCLHELTHNAATRIMPRGVELARSAA